MAAHIDMKFLRIRARSPLCSGLTLVELLVAMTLGLFIVAGIATLVANTGRAHRELANNSRLMENGRYAIQVLRDDIRHAGFYGEFFELADADTPPDPCAGASQHADLEAGMSHPIYGLTNAPECVSDHVPGTDILVIRRTATVPTPLGSLGNGELYLQARPGLFVLERFTGNTDIFNLKQRNGTDPAPIRRYFVRIYYVRNCSDCTGAGDGIPTLSRLELSQGAFGSSQPVADGIENMQLRYGLDDNTNGAPNRLVVSPVAGDWKNVVAVEINLLVRATEQSVGYLDGKSYRLGDVSLDAKDFDSGLRSFKRHVFTSIVRAVNAGGRRE